MASLLTPAEFELLRAEFNARNNPCRGCLCTLRGGCEVWNTMLAKAEHRALVRPWLEVATDMYVALSKWSEHGGHVVGCEFRRARENNPLLDPSLLQGYCDCGWDAAHKAMRKFEDMKKETP